MPGTGPGGPPKGTTKHHGPLEPGAPFGARYRILRVLGAGGMGVVYQAWDDELGVAVALKVIRPEVTEDPYVAREVERRFKRELLLARQVTHKNVVRIHDLGEVDGIKYITMPFIDGRDLASILREGPLTIARALRFAKQIATGLQAAHDAGVVHRDLKPENIMIDADDQAMIMDFGISRSASGTGAGTAVGAVVGTLEYMSPEQARGTVADHRADLYAFGLIFYDMLTGRHRLDATESAIAEMMSRMEQAPPGVQTRAEHVPEPVAKLIATCIEPDAEQRFQTTHALVMALDALDSEGRTVQSAAAPKPSPLRLALAVPIVVAVLLLGALGGWLWSRSRTPAGPPPTPQPVSVVVADFDNRAQDPVFDGALEQALAIAVEGAPFISVYPRRDTLTAAGQVAPGGAGKITKDVGRLILARDDNLKVLLAGGIERAGNGYKLQLEAIEAGSEGPGKIVERTVATKGDVLSAIGSLAQDIIKAIGGANIGNLKAFDDETFTAGSLEAMNAYARGQELSLAGKPLDALKAYEEAVKHDPSFGRAYSGMGVVYGNLKRMDRSKASYEEALKNVNRMTERERFRTLGAYYLQVARNYDEAAKSFKDLVSAYPADNAGHANLAIAYLQLRNVAGAMEEGRKAIDMYPNNLSHRTNYAMYAMYAGDFPTSIKEATEILAKSPGFDFALLTLARAQLAAGDIPAARASYSKLHALGEVGASWAALGLADLEMFEGRYTEAVKILEPAIAADEKAGNQHDAAMKLTALAEAQLELGRRDAAIAAARRASATSTHEAVLVPAGLVLIEAGRFDDAGRIIKTLEEQLQTQTSAYAKLLAGELALQRKNRSDAFVQFRAAVEQHDSWFARYLRGRAWVDAGRAAEGLGDLNPAVNRKGEALDVFVADVATYRYYPGALYWLGRANEANGDRRAASAAYQEYVRIRANANPPDLRAADAARRSGS
jgi:tetratricopeptide (TPR) repeat protein